MRFRTEKVDINNQGSNLEVKGSKTKAVVSDFSIWLTNIIKTAKFHPEAEKKELSTNLTVFSCAPILFTKSVV